MGLNKLAWLLAVDHIVHHVNNYRKEKQQAKKTNKHLTNKLTQLKLGKLTKQKKDKIKAQALLVTTDPEASHKH